jgi:hypothetical protein
MSSWGIFDKSIQEIGVSSQELVASSQEKFEKVESFGRNKDLAKEQDLLYSVIRYSVF